MPDPRQYERIAWRYLDAGNLTSAGVPEAAGFAAYHSFESIGAAWIRHHGRIVPARHVSKLNSFQSLSVGFTFGHGVAHLAILLTAVRNKLLYPVPDGVGGYSLPETVLGSHGAQDLLRRVRGIVTIVSGEL